MRLALVFITLLLAGFGAQTFIIRGVSMAPTFSDGDQVLIEAAANYDRGDVVGLRFKSKAVPFIKRIAAVGGDRVEIQAEVLLVNGKPYQRPGTNAAFPIGVAHARKLAVQLQRHAGSVPAGAYLVLGDNPASSFDSGDYGFVYHDQIIGRAVPVVTFR